MNKYLKSLTLKIAILPLLASCHGIPDVLKPGAWILDQVPEGGTPEFEQGWKDGCESGLAAMSNSFYKAHYSFKQSKELRNNPDYYKVWKDTFNFCRHYVYGTLRQGNVRMKLPMQPNTFLDGFGTVSIFESGPLNNLSPGGGQGEFLQNWGVTGGDAKGPLESMGGTLDFSNDMLGGAENWGMGSSWDFRPKNNLVPY